VGVSPQAIAELAKSGMDEAQFRKLATLFAVELARVIQPTANQVEEIATVQKELMSRAYTTLGQVQRIRADLFDDDVVNTVEKTLAADRRDFKRMLKRHMRIMIGLGFAFVAASTGLSATIAIILANH
jgi:hypothetical protein